MMADFIVAGSIVDIHRDPDPSSELVTQALMNTPIVVGEGSGDWTYVSLPDYSGWMVTNEIETPIVRGYCEGEGTCGITLPYSIVVTAPYTKLYRRSEERRVGKECRSRWSTTDQKKKEK